MNLPSNTVAKEISVTEAVKELDSILDAILMERKEFTVDSLKKDWNLFTAHLGSGILRKIS